MRELRLEPQAILLQVYVMVAVDQIASVYQVQQSILAITDKLVRTTTIQRILHKLEQLGYAEITGESIYNRTKEWSLTPEGNKYLEELIQPALKFVVYCQRIRKAIK